VLPGISPAPLATILTATWVIGVVAWAMSAARSQHRFAVAMSRYVLPSEDLDHDVERLDHERPDDMARAMGHRLEVGSAAWPIAAAGAIAPATVLWLSLLVRDRAYVPVARLEDAIAGHAWALGAFAIAGALAAVVMTRRAARKPLVAIVLAPVAVGAFATSVLATGMDGAWIYGSLAAISAVGAVIVRRLRRERTLIDVADPAAGSELFTIRGAIRALRAGLARTRAGLAAMVAGVQRAGRGTHLVISAIAAIAAATIVAATMFSRSTPRDDDAARARLSAMPHPTAVASVQPAPSPSPEHPLALPTPPPPSPSPFHVEAAAGSFWYEVTLDDHGNAWLPIVDVTTLPRGWQAELDVELVSPDRERGIRVTVDEASTDASVELGPRGRVTKLTIDACLQPKALGFAVAAPHLARKRVTLRVSPVVHVGSCR
jgi:hypothetical protein